MPAPPTSRPTAPPTLTAAPAVISAEPQLRDLKKESTAFLPAALKRKKAAAAGGAVAQKKMKVDAAAAVDGDDGIVEEKPDLMKALRSGLGENMVEKGDGKRKGDEYEAFLAEVGDML